MTRDPRKNPFFVLGLTTTASATEIERAGRRLLAQLEAGATKARVCETPWGPLPLTQDDIRDSMAALREPNARLLAEVFACVDTSSAPPGAAAHAPLEDAFDVVGWKLRA